MTRADELLNRLIAVLMARPVVFMAGYFTSGVALILAALLDVNQVITGVLLLWALLVIMFGMIVAKSTIRRGYAVDEEREE